MSSTRTTATMRTAPPATPTTSIIGETGRTFQFVKYGTAFAFNTNEKKKNRPVIACDGHVAGDNITLELSHWPNNQTPDQYYADTSTEMALQLPSNLYKDAVVVNNHYDTDGVLSIYSLLQPTAARQYADLLKQGAEAGDFGEWSYVGIKLDAILQSFYQESALPSPSNNNEATNDKNDNDNAEEKQEPDLFFVEESPLQSAQEESAPPTPSSSSSSDPDETAYYRAIQELPRILEDLTSTGGESFAHLWKPVVDAAWTSFRRAKLETIPDCPNLVIFHESTSTLSDNGGENTAYQPLVPFAMHRCLRDADLDLVTTRILRAIRSGGDHGYRYEYEKPGHGWVQKLVRRTIVPPVDAAKLVQQLNAEEATGGDGGGVNGSIQNVWATGGSSGMVAICHTTKEIQATPYEVARCLTMLEAGLA